MESFVDQYVSLSRKRKSDEEMVLASDTYPLEVSMNNSPFVDVDQTLSGIP